MPSVQKVGVDDNDGSIVYSGPWSPVTNSGSYDNSLHLATNTGASASLSFTGVSVNIVGSVSPCTTSGAPVQFKVTLGSVVVATSSIACTTQTQNGVTFYSSGTLNNGQHTVSLINQGSSIPLLLDLFAYVTESTEPGDNPGGGSSTITNQAQSTTPGAGVSSPTSAAGPVVTSEPSTTTPGASPSAADKVGSTLGASTVLSLTTINGVATFVPVTMGVSTVMSLTTINGVATSVPLVTSFPVTAAPGGTGTPSPGSSTPGASHGSHSIGAIIGGVIAAVIVILLLLLLLYCRRRRNPRVDSPLHHHLSENLTPFNLDESLSRGQAEPSPTESRSVLPELGLTPFDGSQTHLPITPSEKKQTPEESPTLSPSDPFSSSSDPAYFFDEKRASGPSHSATSGSSLNPSSPSLLLHAIPVRPPSSVVPSDAVPAYVRDTNSSRHRSGLSNLSDRRISQILDTPPSYDSIRDADSRTRPQISGVPTIATDASRFV